MHGGGHDSEVLKELRTAPDLAPRATKVMHMSSVFMGAVQAKGDESIS